MKRFLLPAICLFLILSSCKKKNEVVPVGTLSATIGGVKMSFNAWAKYSIIGLDSTTRQLNVFSNLVNVNSTGFGISVHPNNNLIVKNTYTNAGLDNNPSPIVSIDYYYLRPSGTGSKFYLSDPNNVQPVTVTITSITDTNVQGTFTATLLDDDDRTKTLSVISGKFNVNITN